MRRLDIVREAVKKSKKKLKNVDYIRQYNIVRPSDVIYELDLRSLMDPQDVELYVYPILDEYDDDICYGIWLEHIHYDNGRYEIYREYFDIPVPKEFKNKDL